MHTNSARTAVPPRSPEWPRVERAHLQRQPRSADFESSNLAVVDDAARTFYGMDATAIKSDLTWLRKKASRLAPLEKMTASDKEAFREAMNRRLPLERAARTG